MSIKERNQHASQTDIIRLRLFTFNGTSASDIYEINGINIYVCDPTAVTIENHSGKVLVTQIDPINITHNCTGEYFTDLNLTSPEFVVGSYTDEWVIVLEDESPVQSIENHFKVYAQTWYTAPLPFSNEVSFSFQPNKIRKGSIQYIRILSKPVVNHGSLLENFYESLMEVGGVLVTMCSKCNPCPTFSSDLNTIFEDQPVMFQDRCYSYYLIDSTELDCGVYSLVFTLKMGGNTYVSDSMNLLIYE